MRRSEIGADLQRHLDLLRAKNDPKTDAAIAADINHASQPSATSASTPASALILNAMVFKHTKYPNAAKEYLRFMMEQEQYDPG